MTMKAIIKINEEMQKNPQDKYTEIIGHYLIDRCNSPQIAMKLLEDKKSLKGAMDAVLATAQKKKQGNVAVLTPQEVFAEVDGYFGIQTDEPAQSAAIASVMGGSVAQPQTKEEKKLAMASSSEMTIFKLHFEQGQESINKMTECIGRMADAGDTDGAVKLKNALYALLTSTLEVLK